VAVRNADYTSHQATKPAKVIRGAKPTKSYYNNNSNNIGEFLMIELNGYRFSANEADAAQAVLALAVGTLNEASYAAFLRANT
jgi:hypothetical protein